MAVADFNRDGKPDLMAACETSKAVCVYLGNGDGTFQPRLLFGAWYAPFRAVVADFDRDGWPDIAAAQGSSGTIAVLLNNARYRVRRSSIYSKGCGAR